MCGLVCVVPKWNTRGLSHPEMAVFETLVTIDTLRGVDSTGIFTSNDTDVQLIKEAVTGPQLMLTTDYKELRKAAIKDGRFVVAHNRAATRGVVNDKNAHPFWKDNKVVMVHNGTFLGDHRKHADTEVDSEALCHLLAEHEPDQIDQVLSKISAAYALIWYDSRDDSLNLIRNDQRPLYMVESDTAWYFSSEYLMLQFAMVRVDIKLPKDVRPVLLAEHDHHKFSFKNNKTALITNKVTLSFRQDRHLDDLEDHWNRFGMQYVPHERRAAACAYDTKPVVNNNPVTVVTGGVQQSPNGFVSQQHQQRLEQHTRQDKYIGNSFADKIVDDAATVPMLPWNNFNTYREAYKHGSLVDFYAKNIVSLEDNKYIVYGNSSFDDDVLVGALITGDDFTRLIEINSRTQKLRGNISVTLFKNMVTTTDIQEMSGAVIVQLNNLTKVNEGANCGC